jgi:hypothetical protein
MQSVIHRKNPENYRRQLAETKDQATRVQPALLLAEEEAKSQRRPGGGTRSDAGSFLRSAHMTRETHREMTSR